MTKTRCALLNEISLINAHAHLNELDDLSETLHRAKFSGIKGIVAVGMDLDSNKKTLSIAETHRRYVFPGIGNNPWEIRKDEIDENLSLKAVQFFQIG